MRLATIGRRGDAVARCVLLLALGLAFSAYGQGDRFTGVEPRRPIPPLHLQDIHGATHDIAALRGRVVMVNFWATWCAPCVEELPSLQRLWADRHPRGLEVLAVNAGENRETVEAFLAGFRPGLEFPVLLDRSSAAFGAWKVFGLPTTFVIDKQGRLAYYATGARPMDSMQIRAQITNLLSESDTDK